MPSLRISRRAERDLIEIWKWVARDDPRIADRIIHDIRARCLKLEQFPLMGRPRPEIGDGARSLVYERWMIAYHQVADEVVVVRVVAASRDLSQIDFGLN